MNWRAPYSPPLPARNPRSATQRPKELHIPVMTIRTRKFFGTIFLLVLVVVWSLMGMTIAQTPWLANSGLLQAIFYVVAGLGWVLPAMPIISWMSRPHRRKHYSGQHHAQHAQRALPSVPGDARQGVQIGIAPGLDDARDRRDRAG